MTRVFKTAAHLAFSLLLAALIASCGAASPAVSASPACGLGKISMEEARACIQSWLSRNVPGFNMEMLSELEETDFGIIDLNEDTSTQFFTLGTYAYAVCGGEARRFACLSALAAETADVDGDGLPELVLLCENGSGLYIYQLIVVKDGVPYDHVVENNGASHGYRMQKDGSAGLFLYRATGRGVEPAGEICLGEVRLIDGRIALVGGEAETAWNDTMPKGIPEPPDAALYVETDGGIICRGLEAGYSKEYFAELEKNGYRKMPGARNNDYQIAYASDRFLLLLYPGTYYIKISYRYIDTNPSENGGLSNAQAADLIVAGGYEREVDVVALNEPELWEKMRLQVFCQPFGNYYFIQDGKVESDPYFEDYCTADIDGDGEYEFLNHTYMGYGITIAQIRVFKNGSPYAFNGWLTNPGYGFFNFRFVKVDDSTVKMLGIYWNENQVRTEKDLGRLAIRMIEGNMVIEPEINPMDVFPMYKYITF